MNKILVIHTKYQNIGGEDIAVDKEVEYLSKYFEVETLYFSNNIKSYFRQLIYLLINRNFESDKKVKEKISSFSPDLIYIHNTWFKASLGIFSVIKKINLPYVIKLHNFRYDCTRYVFAKNHFKSSDYCNLCGLDKKSMGLLNSYFPESKIKSIFVIIYGKKYFRILKNEKNNIFVLTKFHKIYLSNLLDNSRNIKVLPNSIDISNANKKNNNSEKFIVYAGRISKEKGVEELIKTFNKVNLENIELKIIGDGPYLTKLKQKYIQKNIKFLGAMSNNDTIDIISKSLAVVTATKLYEGQPTLLCEASLLGIPSIFPDTGGIKEFFPNEYELKFEQFNYDDLEKKLLNIHDEEFLLTLGKKNKEYISNFFNNLNLQEKLVSIHNHE